MLKLKSDYLGKVIITPKVVAKTINAMKDTKSPGVDGIPPRVLMETVEQVSIPLERVFNLSLIEGVILRRRITLVCAPPPAAASLVALQEIIVDM